MLEAQSSSIGEVVSPLEAEAIAASAYIFGYPLVLFERVHAAVAKSAASSPFAGDEHGVSIFCLDLALATFVLRISDRPLEIRDAWTNVIASFGMGATEGVPRAMALVRSGWRGCPPDSLERIAAPTDLVCVVSPAGTNPFGPPIAEVSARSLAEAVEQVSRMGAGMFLSRLARLMRSNPPAANDDPLLARLRRIGIAPGEPTRLACLPGELKPALVSGVAAARAAMADRARVAASERRTDAAQPRFDSQPQARETDYSRRALWASTGLLGLVS